MGTGTGTTTCSGGLDLGGPGCRGTSGSTGGGAGVLCCASKIGDSSKATEIVTKTRFMGGKAGTLNRVIENQDWDMNLQLVFGDILTCHTLHPFKSRIAVLRPRCPWQLRSTRHSFKAIPCGHPPTMSSNSGAIENRFNHLFRLEEFAGKIVSSPRMFCVIAIDLFHRVNNFPQRSKG